MIEKYDSKERYCPKLGHHLNFRYCRLSNEKLPCSKIADCWFEFLPITEFLNQNYSKEELQHIFKPQKSKVESIYDLILKAQQTKNSSKP